MQALRKGDRELMREINHHLVLNLLKTSSPISQREIVRLSGLSPATVSGITADLTLRGLVSEIGVGESASSRGGRKPVLLRLNQQAGYVLGVKLMEHAIVAVVTDLQANVVYTHTAEVPGYEDVVSDVPRPPQQTIRAVITAIEATIRASSVDRKRLLGIGIGVSGLVDNINGVCRVSRAFPGWSDVPVAEVVSQHFALPVYVENDVKTLTIAEQWFGHGAGLDHFLLVTLGRGIGAGFVVNGQFYRGAQDGAGEFGHVTIREDGPRCECGKHGCLEAFASEPAIVRQARAAVALGEPTLLADNDVVTIDDVIAAAQQGDALAQRLFADAGRFLGIGLANMVNLLNPQVIIIGGEGVRAGQLCFGPMYDALHNHVFDGLANDLHIVIEPFADEAWARGAACVVLGDLFTPPGQKKLKGARLIDIREVKDIVGA